MNYFFNFFCLLVYVVSSTTSLYGSGREVWPLVIVNDIKNDCAITYLALSKNLVERKKTTVVNCHDNKQIFMTPYTTGPYKTTYRFQLSGDFKDRGFEHYEFHFREIAGFHIHVSDLIKATHDFI